MKVSWGDLMVLVSRGEEGQHDGERQAGERGDSGYKGEKAAPATRELSAVVDHRGSSQHF